MTDPNSIGDNNIDSAFYVSLFASYNLLSSATRRLQIFGNISNLFDKSPLLPPELQHPGNPVHFDQIGRQYRIGLRFNY